MARRDRLALGLERPLEVLDRRGVIALAAEELADRREHRGPERVLDRELGEAPAVVGERVVEAAALEQLLADGVDDDRGVRQAQGSGDQTRAGGSFTMAEVRARWIVAARGLARARAA